MRKAKSRLPAKYRKDNRAKTFFTGLLLGGFMTTVSFLYFNNAWIRSLLSDSSGNQCSEIMSTVSESDLSLLVKKVEASEPVRYAKITAYSCGGLKTQAEIDMNCPSLRYSKNGRTANGTEPIPYKTMACDPANMGRTFWIEGIGEVTCTDTGGAIKQAGRFDLYLETVEEARAWGVQTREYRLLSSN